MKKLKILLIFIFIIFSSCSCSKSETDSDTSEYLSESDSSIVSEESSVDIVNGKYYYTGGNGYVEITEGKYFQLVDFDESFIDDFVKFYAQRGSVGSLYFDKFYLESNNLTVDPTEVKKRALESTQLKNDIVDKKAEFVINIVPDMTYALGTDCELTYFMDEVGLWFPLIYFKNEDPKRLLFEHFGYEFILKE